jgi:hypothetical protein
MAHRYRHAVSVTTNGEGQPIAFTWRGRRYRIDAVIGEWHLMDRWWERKSPQGAEALLMVRARANRYHYRV